MNFAFLLFLVPFTLFQITLSQTTTNSECNYVYGDWSECINFKQTRTKECVCSGTVADAQKCDQTPLVEQDCEDTLVPCEFRWSRWSVCTAECGSGNITRIPQCFCDGQTEPVSNDFCNQQEFFGRETVPCNQFACGDVPALNKLYWMSRIDSISWPIEDTVFNCTRGNDPEDSPKGKTYSEILADPYPSSHKNYLWYYLAKEWIAAQLNTANGVKFPEEALRVVKEVGMLLEKCDGYTVEDPMLYSLKEKLGRINNNIGGLSNVDIQTKMMLAGNYDNEKGVEHNSRLTFVLAIAVPVAAVMIIAFALGLTVYYVRDKTTVAKEEFESEDDEPLQNSLIMSESKPVEVMPLEEQSPLPVTKDDSEEQLL
jgi:hypothetical protein